jgi:hypothetical protein
MNTTRKFKYTVLMYGRDMKRFGHLRLFVRLSDGGAIEIDRPLLDDLMAERYIGERTPRSQAAPFVLTVPHGGIVLLTRNEWGYKPGRGCLERKFSRLRKFMGFKLPKSTKERDETMTSKQLLAKYEDMKKTANAWYPRETGATSEFVEGVALGYLSPLLSLPDMRKLLKAIGNPALQAAMAPIVHMGGIFA